MDLPFLTWIRSSPGISFLQVWSYNLKLHWDLLACKNFQSHLWHISELWRRQINENIRIWQIPSYCILILSAVVNVRIDHAWLNNSRVPNFPPSPICWVDANAMSSSLKWMGVVHVHVYCNAAEAVHCIQPEMYPCYCVLTAPSQLSRAVQWSLFLCRNRSALGCIVEAGLLIAVQSHNIQRQDRVLEVKSANTIISPIYRRSSYNRPIYILYCRTAQLYNKLPLPRRVASDPTIHPVLSFTFTSAWQWQASISQLELAWPVCSRCLAPKQIRMFPFGWEDVP